MTPPHKKKPPHSSNSLKLRIIGGQWRGRILPFPDVNGLRPSGSRIRETLFNWLMPFLPDSRCLDLYAGSGALGFEALSRGASFCQFIELNTLAAKQLKQNTQTLNTTAAQIAHSNTLEYLKTPPAAPFDIVFLDPPFAEKLWDKTCELLNTKGWLNEGAHIYIETPSQFFEPLPSSWELLKQKKAGQVRYSLYRKA